MSVNSGLLLVVFAGLMNASFTLPMKCARNWRWENTWLLWAIFALAIFPPAVLLLTAPDPRQIYHVVGGVTLAVLFGCGIGLGLCQLCFGLAVDMIGITLTFAIASGVAAGVGSLAPLLIFHRSHVLTTSGKVMFAGVALVACGVGLCAKAGRRREAALQLLRGTDTAHMIEGLTLATVSGIMAASMNIGLDYGARVITAAAHSGVQRLWRTNVVWVPMFLAASIPNLAYCVHLLRKRGTFALFRQGSATYWMSPILMAALWFGSILLYGFATIQLGTLGAVLGWPLLESVIVIAAGVLGISLGEWRGAGRGPLRLQFGGIAILILAIFVISGASR